MAKAAERWSAVPSDGMQVYKADYNTGRSESLPFIYNTAQIDADLQKTGKVDPRVKESVEPSLFHALYDAQRLNTNIKISPEEVVTLLAQEGRSDLGANKKDVVSGWQHNPQSVALHAKLRDMGYNAYDAGTAALLLDKQMTARRISEKQGRDIPWTAVWNGLGTDPKTGRTGFDYAREFAINAKNIAANKAAVEYVRRHMTEPVNNTLAVNQNNAQGQPIYNYLMP